MTRVVLVPGVPALLPEHASLRDPVAALRKACLSAVRWLGAVPRVVADEQGARVAAYLVEEAVRDGAGRGDGDAWLVVGNGSARRTPTSPGPYDERAVRFDEELGRGLLGPSPAALRDLDPSLAEDLWAQTGGFAALADLLEGASVEAVDFDGDPFGVQYWVVRWTR